MRQKLLLLLCALMASAAASAFDFEVDGIYYDKLTETTCAVMSGDRNSVYVNIPETVSYEDITYTVTSIGFGAFHNCTKLISIEIPNTVTTIDNSAFFYCDHLTSIEIPNTVTSIGFEAFYGCSRLPSIKIPNSVTVIEEGAFNQCSTLTSIKIPNSVTSIGKSAFAECYGLTTVEIANSVTSIGESAFKGCSNLTTIEMSNSITSIADNTFESCRSLTSIEIPESVTSIGSSAFDNCWSLTTIEIPESVTSIGNLAFYDCDNLASIEIPNSVISIGEGAFAYCSNLTSITIENKNPANISLKQKVFYKIPASTCTLYVPRGSKALYAASDQWKDFTNIKEFGPVNIIDGEVYDAIEGETDVDVNYIRNFTTTEWQPLYIPFNMSYEEWSPYADVAEVHNVRGFDSDRDGEIDYILIEFNKLSSGEIVPNIPYVIRPKSTGEVTFECTGKTLLAVPEEEGSVECSSTKMTYSFHGVYQPKTDLYSSGAYLLTGGTFHPADSNAEVLSPNRFYLQMTPKTGGYNPSPAPRTIRMLVNGEDTTSIDGIEIASPNDDIYYDLMGRRVDNPTPGIYIQNGRKVIVR